MEAGRFSAASASTAFIAWRRSMPGASVAVIGTARRWPFAPQLGRDRPLAHRDEGGERHHASLAGADEDVLQVARILDRAVGRGGAHRDGVAVDIELAHLAPVEECGERRPERLHRDAEIGGGLAVDADGELRLRRVVVERHASKAGSSSIAACIVSAASASSPYSVPVMAKLQALAAAADAEAVRRARGDRDAGNRLQLAVQLLRDLPAASASRSVPGRERQHDEAGIGIPHAGEQEEVGRLAALEQRLHDRLDLAHAHVDDIRRRRPAGW